MALFKRRVAAAKASPPTSPGNSKAARLAADLGRIETKRRNTVRRVRIEQVEAGLSGNENAASGNGDNVVVAAGAEELEKLRTERDEYLNLARRERAELDNYRKRVARDRENLKRESLAGFLKEFFGPLDDLDRVLVESEKTHSYDTLQAGVRILEENLWRALAKAGVKKINAKGKPFNPEFHEAMAAVPSTDAQPNTVLEVYDNGYKLDDFVLRPARVVVSKEPDN